MPTQCHETHQRRSEPELPLIGLLISWIVPDEKYALLPPLEKHPLELYEPVLKDSIPSSLLFFSQASSVRQATFLLVGFAVGLFVFVVGALVTVG